MTERDYEGTLHKIEEVRQRSAESAGALKELEKQMRDMGYMTLEQFREAIKKQEAKHKKLMAEVEKERKLLEKEIQSAQEEEE